MSDATSTSSCADSGIAEGAKRKERPRRSPPPLDATVCRHREGHAFPRVASPDVVPLPQPEAPCSAVSSSSHTQVNETSQLLPMTAVFPS